MFAGCNFEAIAFPFSTLLAATALDG